jgi:hypothetical protein
VHCLIYGFSKLANLLTTGIVHEVNQLQQRLSLHIFPSTKNEIQDQQLVWRTNSYDRVAPVVCRVGVLEIEFYGAYIKFLHEKILYHEKIVGNWRQ